MEQSFRHLLQEMPELIQVAPKSFLNAGDGAEITAFGGVNGKSM